MKNMWIYHEKFHWIFMGFTSMVLVISDFKIQWRDGNENVA